MEENEIYEALGLEPPQEEQDLPGEQEPEEDEIPEDQDGDHAPDPAADDADADPETQDSDPDALRREYERQMEDLRRNHTAQLDQMAASLGLKNPYNGNAPIMTHAQLLAYQEQAAQAKLAQFKQAAGMTDAQFDEMVASLPEVQAAKQAKDAADQAQAEANRRELRAKLDSEIADIGKLCPGIKSDLDLVNHESYPRIQQLMRDNPAMGVYNAFRLANFDQLTKQNASASAQQVRNNLQGKRHLKGTGGRGRGGSSVTEEEMNIYRRMNPGITDEEIHAHYTRSMKK